VPAMRKLFFLASLAWVSLACEPSLLSPGMDLPSASGGSPPGGGSGGVASSGGASSSGGLPAVGGAAGGSSGAGGTGGSSGGGTAAGGSTGSGGAPGDAWLSTSETVRILPLGDSITAEGSCWRHDLWAKLVDAGYENVDFVGGQTADDCGGGYDADHEGHGGVLVTEVTVSEMASWFAAADADVVLLHFATNDVWNGVSTEAILAAHLQVLEQLRAVNPDVILLEAQIIPMSSTECAPCVTTIPALNAAMPAWASENSTATSPIFVVDQYTDFDSAVDTTDGVHPYTTTGADKMASRWFDALVDLY
jgi:hypothetical protein